MEALPLYFKEGQGVWCTVISRPRSEKGTIKLSLIGGWDGEAPVICIYSTCNTALVLHNSLVFMCIHQPNTSLDEVDNQTTTQQNCYFAFQSTSEFNRKKTPCLLAICKVLPGLE